MEPETTAGIATAATAIDQSRPLPDDGEVAVIRYTVGAGGCLRLPRPVRSSGGTPTDIDHPWCGPALEHARNTRGPGGAGRVDPVTGQYGEVIVDGRGRCHNQWTGVVTRSLRTADVGRTPNRWGRRARPTWLSGR